MEVVLVTGGSGTIGRNLIPKLIDAGYEVRLLSRSKKKVEGTTSFFWSVGAGEIEKGALEGVDHIVHLAGTPVSERWMTERKEAIRKSRIKSIQVIQKHLGDQKLKSFISASGVSIYGTKTSEKIFDEKDEIEVEKNDFLAQVTVDWETAAQEMSANAGRVVIFRTPVVLSAKGGALERIVKPVKFGIGSPLGSGKQYMPWIHIDDLTNAYLKAVQSDSCKGIYNAVAPEQINNANFTKKVAKVLGKPYWAPNVPKFALHLLFGEMADIVLKGSRVSGEKILTTGFEFEYPDVDSALTDLLAD